SCTIFRCQFSVGISFIEIPRSYFIPLAFYSRRQQPGGCLLRVSDLFSLSVKFVQIMGCM
ncbi:hypothetical protein D5282_26705, partial [bacterium 1xD8-48]|nr:hypothetical protein [bacterium 1xD8-48]